MKKILLPALISLILTAIAVYGIFVWRNTAVRNSQNQHSSLQQSVNKLQTELADAKAASNISTANWKEYCDSLSKVCMSYPSDWTLQGGQPDSYPMINATLTSASKSMKINYIDPMVKDGDAMSMHIVSLNNMTVGSSKVTIVGAIPVSSGSYTPVYYVLDSSDITSSMTPGKVALIFAANPFFTEGTPPLNSITMTGSPKSFTSYAQAQAWFNSIDGKTMLNVFESLSKQ
jgi:hypothetical protein